MSSKTSAGKKKVKRLKVDFASMRVTPQVVKVEFTPPLPQVIELKSGKDMQEEDQRTNDPAESLGVNWRIVGFFSALFPVIGTGVLFMLGWAYEVSWYGYFGVNVSQVNTTPQNILIQSIPAIITFITASVIATSTYYFFSMGTKYIRQYIQINQEGNQGNTSSKSSKVFFGIKDWFFVDMLTLVIVYAYLVLNYPRFDFWKMQTYEIFYLQFFIVFGVLGLIVSFFLLFSVLSVSYLFVSVILFIIKRGKQEGISISTYYKKPQGLFPVFVILSVNVMTLLALSSSFGINDASVGIRGSGGWKIQAVLISSSVKLPITSPELSQGCMNANCVYGPFGFIDENDKSYILIQWQKDKDEKFFSQPGLYIIPRSDSTYLIPTSP